MVALRLTRPLLALGASLLVHAGVVALVVGAAVVPSLSFRAPVEIELVAQPTPPPQELPLGPPPVAKPARSGGVAAVRPKRVAKASEPGGTLASADAGADGGAPEGDAGVPSDAGSRDAGPRGLDKVGPDGSRLTALLRLDRLRRPEAAPLVPVADRILGFLPDYHRFIARSGLDLYKDFDTLLVATPNVLDDAVTFLVVRHHLEEATLKAALDRASAASGRAITWRTERGRAVGERAASGGRRERDDRLILLPGPGIAVVAAPAYARILLGGTLPDGGVVRGVDFEALVAQIEAEEAAMAEDAVFSLAAAGLVSARGAASVPPTRGAMDEDLLPPTRPTLPAKIALTATVTPDPVFELVGTFDREADARRWHERELPEQRRRALGNPLIVLGGFAPAITRITHSQDDRALTVRVPLTREELARLVELASGFARRGF